MLQGGLLRRPRWRLSSSRQSSRTRRGSSSTRLMSTPARTGVRFRHLGTVTCTGRRSSGQEQEQRLPARRFLCMLGLLFIYASPRFYGGRALASYVAKDPRSAHLLYGWVADISPATIDTVVVLAVVTLRANGDDRADSVRDWYRAQPGRPEGGAFDHAQARGLH